MHGGTLIEIEAGLVELREEYETAVVEIDSRLGLVEVDSAVDDASDRCGSLESEVASVSSIVMALKAGLDTTREQMSAQSQELGGLVEIGEHAQRAAVSSEAAIDVIRSETADFTDRVDRTTTDMRSLLCRILAMEFDEATAQGDEFLARTNLRTVDEHNQAVSRRLVRLTRAIDRLSDKVDTCQKGQQSAWDTIQLTQARLQTIRETVVRISSGKTGKK